MAMIRDQREGRLSGDRTSTGNSLRAGSGTGQAKQQNLHGLTDPAKKQLDAYGPGEKSQNLSFNLPGMDFEAIAEQASPEYAAYKNALLQRGNLVSEMEKLSGQISGAQKSAGVIEQERQNAADQARAQSLAASRRGINPGLAAKMQADTMARMRGQGQQAVAERGLSDYYANVDRLGAMADQLNSQDVNKYGNLAQGAAQQLQQKYLTQQYDRQRQLKEALAQSGAYWNRQAAIAGKPKEPSTIEKIGNVTAKLLPVAASVMGA